MKVLLSLLPLLLVLAQEKPRPAPEARLDASSLDALQRDPRKLPRGAHADATPVPPDMKAAVVAIRERDLPRALAALYRALDSAPDFPPALYELGVVYFRLQRYGDGAAALERYLEVAPDHVADTRALGHCYYSLGAYAQAKAHYERVLAAAPKEPEAWRGLALSEMHLGDAKKALEHLERVLEIDPRHADAWTWKAEILFDADRSEDALAAAEKARDLDRWQPRAWFLLGRILLDLGKEKEGLAAQARYREIASAADRVHTIESSLEYGPHDVALLRNLVELHRATGNFPAARVALARLVKERPGDVELRIYALDVLEGMGDAEGARTAALAMKQRCAEEGKAWRRLERYFAHTGERLEQAQAGEKARRLGAD